MRSRCNVFLVRKGNPKGVFGVADLLRDGVRLFLSNPVTETLSYQAYADSLRNMAKREGLRLAFLDHARSENDPGKLVYGNLVHHREAPQTLAEDRADVAMIYYHLALRYQRIFPDMFDIVRIGKASATEECDPLNIVSQFNCGLVADGGEWGPALLDYLMSETVAEVYVKHGLIQFAIKTRREDEPQTVQLHGKAKSTKYRFIANWNNADRLNFSAYTTTGECADAGGNPPV